MEVVQLLGSQGFWQRQVLRGVGGEGSRNYSALGGDGSQYWPMHSSVLAGESPSLTESLAGHSLQGHKKSYTVKGTLGT